MSSLRSTEAQANDATEVLNYFRTWITFKNRSFLPARYRAWLFDNMYLCEEVGGQEMSYL